MAKARWTLLKLVVICATGSGCSLQRTPTEQSLQLTDASNGTEINASVGQRVVLDLASNVSTGYQWTLVNSNPSSLRQDDSKYISPADDGRVGASGKQEWTFTAITPGEAKLHLEYRRPFESKDIAAAKTFDAIVGVTAP